MARGILLSLQPETEGPAGAVGPLSRAMMLSRCEASLAQQVPLLTYMMMHELCCVTSMGKGSVWSSEEVTTEIPEQALGRQKTPLQFYSLENGCDII